MTIIVNGHEITNVVYFLIFWLGIVMPTLRHYADERELAQADEAYLAAARRKAS